MSSFNWGADRTTLLRIYQALCLCKFEYGCQVYGSACKTILAKLDVVHNMASRICTGAYRTLPIESLYVESGIPPLFIPRDEFGLRYVSRVLTSKLNPNFKYMKQPTDRAPTRPRLPKPLEVRLAASADQIRLTPSAVSEICPPKFPPWFRLNVKICSVRASKSNSSDAQLRASFLEHASEHDNSCHIYTYGSKSSSGVGCSVVTPDNIIKKGCLLILLYLQQNCWQF